MAGQTPAPARRQSCATGPIARPLPGIDSRGASGWCRIHCAAMGSCNGGPLPVGTWWPERALMYARYQTSWLGPPGH